MMRSVFHSALVSSLALPLGCARTSASGESSAKERSGERVASAPAAPAREVTPVSTGWTTAVPPKPLSAAVRRALDWLSRTQQDNGGWTQGEEAVNMCQGAGVVKDAPNVAETCTAALALIRSGSTPREGPSASAVRRALDFVCKSIEASDRDSLYVTDLRGTRVQSKLGPYIDTFLASMLLAEARGRMPDPASERRVAAAHDKVLDKIARNQKQDGSWDERGWAPVLAQSVAGKGLNRSRQAGAAVSDEILDRTASRSAYQYDPASGGFDGAGSAGVKLYSSAANLGILGDSDNTNVVRERTLLALAESAPKEEDRKKARMDLEKIAANRKVHGEAQTAVVEQLQDPQFRAGFGSNGGEEFLSYMNIAENLVVKGGDEWKRWDAEMTANLERIQNGDGSWSGHHCITGRTFCTSAALLVLMADRTPVPLAAVASGR